MICIKHICGALLLPPVTRCSSQPDRSHCIAKTTASLLQQCHHIITQDSTTTRRSSKNRQQQPLLLLHHRLFPLILKSRYHANINLFPFAAAAAAESLRLPATTIAPPGDDDDDAALSLDWALLLPGEMCVTRNETPPYAGTLLLCIRCKKHRTRGPETRVVDGHHLHQEVRRWSHTQALESCRQWQYTSAPG